MDLEAARRVDRLEHFEPDHFYRDVSRTTGRIACWPFHVPIPEFHAHLAYLDQFPFEWTERQLRAFLLQALHPEVNRRTRFYFGNSGLLFTTNSFQLYLIVLSARSHAFSHPPTWNASTLPADIPNDVWHRFNRRQAIVTLMGTSGLADLTSPAYHTDAEPDWDDNAMRLEVMRRYYDTSIRERDSRNIIWYGLLLLEALRVALPEGAPLQEALNITAQLKTLGFIFLDDPPPTRYTPTPRPSPTTFGGPSEPTPSRSVVGPTLRVSQRSSWYDPKYKHTYYHRININYRPQYRARRARVSPTQR